MKPKNLYDSVAIIEHDYGTIEIPLKEVFSTSELDDIAKYSADIDELRMDIEDQVYEYFTSTLSIRIDGLQ